MWYKVFWKLIEMPPPPPPPKKKKKKKNECKIIVSYCTLPPHWLFLNGKFQNISIPASTEGKGNSKGRGVQKDAIFEGVSGGGGSWGLFPGALSKTGKLLKTNSCSVEQAGSYFKTRIIVLIDDVFC